MEIGQNSVRIFPGRHRSEVTALTIVPSGNLAVSGSYDGDLMTWNVRTGQSIRIFDTDKEWIVHVLITADGHHMIAAYHDNTVITYDFLTGKQLYAFGGRGSTERHMPMLKGTDYVVCASRKSVYVWDVVRGRRIATLRGHSDSVTTISATPDGRRIATGSKDNNIKLWDVRSRAEICTLRGHSGWIHGLWVVPSSRYAISSSVDRSFRMWNLLTGKQIWMCEKDVGVINHVEYIPGTSRAITTNVSTSALTLWDYMTGDRVSTLNGHEGQIDDICITRDGRLMASASKDKSVRLWDLQSGKTICLFMGENAITHCLFSEDERTIIAGEASGVVHFLKIHDGGPASHGQSRSFDLVVGTQQRPRDAQEASISRCCFCNSELDTMCVEVPPGLLCIDCLSNSLDRIGASVELGSLTHSEIIDALLPEGDLLSRLAVLWRFREVFEVAEADEKPELLQVLVDNLGYIDEGVSHIVRQLAYERCVSPPVWDDIVPVVLRNIHTEPWQFYANALLVLGGLEPDNPEIKKVLDSASGDVRSEIRSFVLSAIDHHDTVWTRALVERLLSDPDHEVREQAKGILGKWDAK